MNIYLFKINNRNTRRRCETCLKLTLEIRERRQLYRSGVLIVSFQHISHLFLELLLLTLSIYLFVGMCDLMNECI